MELSEGESDPSQTYVSPFRIPVSPIGAPMGRARGGAPSHCRRPCWITECLLLEIVNHDLAKCYCSHLGARLAS